MFSVYLSLGSNINADVNLRAAIDALKEQYGQLELSTVYQNRAVGFEGDDFLNLVVGLRTEQSIPEIVEFLHRVEASRGRDRRTGKFSARTLDMDLLLYGSEIYQSDSVFIPRDEITRYAFVLQPLQELIPEFQHPIENKTIQQLWDSFDKTNLDMRAVTIL